MDANKDPDQMACDDALRQYRRPNESIEVKEEDEQAIERTAMQVRREEQIILGIRKDEGKTVDQRGHQQVRRSCSSGCSGSDQGGKGQRAGFPGIPGRGSAPANFTCAIPMGWMGGEAHAAPRTRRYTSISMIAERNAVKASCSARAMPVMEMVNILISAPYCNGPKP